LLTSQSRVLLEKLIVVQLVKKFIAFYGIRKLTTGFIRALTDPYPEPDECSQYPVSSRLNIITPSTLKSAKCYVPFTFSN
jgi:hypothetical protein